jgi:hypothetical protein
MRLRERARYGHAAERATEEILEDLFTAVLDWSVGDLSHQVGRADLLLSRLGIKYLIVEAKRPGALTWSRPALDEALCQAWGYACEQGVQSIAVSDGYLLYAADLEGGGLRGRALVRLDSAVGEGDLWWLSVDGIDRRPPEGAEARLQALGELAPGPGAQLRPAVPRPSSIPDTACPPPASPTSGTPTTLAPGPFPIDPTTGRSTSSGAQGHPGDRQQLPECAPESRARRAHPRRPGPAGTGGGRGGQDALATRGHRPRPPRPGASAGPAGAAGRGQGHRPTRGRTGPMEGVRSARRRASGPVGRSWGRGHPSPGRIGLTPVEAAGPPYRSRSDAGRGRSGARPHRTPSPTDGGPAAPGRGPSSAASTDAGPPRAARGARVAPARPPVGVAEPPDQTRVRAPRSGLRPQPAGSGRGLGPAPRGRRCRRHRAPFRVQAPRPGEAGGDRRPVRPGRPTAAGPVSHRRLSPRPVPLGSRSGRVHRRPRDRPPRPAAASAQHARAHSPGAPDPPPRPAPSQIPIRIGTRRKRAGPRPRRSRAPAVGVGGARPALRPG